MERPGVIQGLAIGAAAGLFAAFVMERSQAFLSQAMPAVAAERDEPSTERAADKTAVALGGGPAPDRAKAGRLVHYATGAGLGMLYVTAARAGTAATAGFGTLYGALLSLVLDEVIVPALDLGPPPWKTPRETHLYGLANHLVFGAALEAGRRVGSAAL